MKTRTWTKANQKKLDSLNKKWRDQKATTKQIMQCQSLRTQKSLAMNGVA